MRNSSDTECMIILLVLIGILALLSFYTVVICTGLLVYHVSAGWQETLQVVSALCILWFFLFVILVGLLYGVISVSKFKIPDASVHIFMQAVKNFMQAVKTSCKRSKT